MDATLSPNFSRISARVASPPWSSAASCSSAAIAYASVPSASITKPATVSR